jgi:hypothetical protein
MQQHDPIELNLEKYTSLDEHARQRPQEAADNSSPLHSPV